MAEKKENEENYVKNVREEKERDKSEDHEENGAENEDKRSISESRLE